MGEALLQLPKHQPTWSDVIKTSRSGGRNTLSPNLWQGLRGHWTGLQGGGSKWFDISGYDNTGTPTNMDAIAAWQMTSGGMGIDFAGENSGDMIQLENKISFTDTTWTLSWWMDIDLQYNFYGLFGHLNTTDNKSQVYITSGGRFDLFNDAYSASIQSPQILTGLHHYAVTHTGSRASLWADGEFGYEDTTSTGTYTFYRLGNRGEATGGDAMNGRLLDFRLWDRELRASEIESLFVEPNASVTPKAFQMAVSWESGEEYSPTLYSATSSPRSADTWKVSP